MLNNVLGIHHITAIAKSAQHNYEFYTKVLGLRLVKRTVNFDDPGTYHFYYGNETGAPGTILTFFPWEGIGSGYTGTGMVTEIGYSVPEGSLEFWIDRFNQYEVKYEQPNERFHEQYLSFQDPDGLKINLIVPKEKDIRIPWQTDEINEQRAVRGFHSITLTLKSIKATASILTDVFEYTLREQEDGYYRFKTDAIDNAAIVDLEEAPGQIAGYVAGGTNHHVAFRVQDENILMEFREKILQRGIHITPKIDRNYFFSIYFREPGGVLFELATDNPGFMIDEPLNELGTHLKLPSQFENDRERLEKILPQLK